MLLHQVQVFSDEIEDFLVPEPATGLAVDLERRWIEVNEMPPILKRGDIGVHRLPHVPQYRHTTRCLEFSGDSAPIQPRRVGLPTERLDQLGLTKRLEQPNPLPVSVEAVHIVQNNQLIAVFVGLDENAKRARIPVDPAHVVADCLSDVPTLANPGTPENEEQVQ